MGRVINSQLAAQDLIVIQVTDSTGCGLVVDVFSEAVSFGTAGFTVEYKTKADNAANNRENFDNLSLGEA